jgi:translocation and assembly module TamA
MAWIRLLGLALLAAAFRCRAADPVVLKIEGLREPLEKNVRALLTLAGEDAASTAERIRLAEQRAPDEVREALEPFGYYRPKISGSVSRRENKWFAFYRVDPGPAITVSKVDVRLYGEARNEPEIRALVDRFPLKQGDVLDHTLYEKGKGALESLSAEMGFFDARFRRHEIRVDLKPYDARIVLYLDSGKRARFGEVKFSDSPLDTELLQRFVRFKPGDPFRASKMLALQRSLLNSGYFNRADVAPKVDEKNNGITPIAVELGMAPRNRYELGAGFGTDTGPRVSLGYRNRFVNSYGHTFQASARLSLIWNEIDAVYAIPLADPEKDQLAFTGKSGLEDTVAGRTKVARGGVRHTTTRWDLREILALDFSRENFTIAGVNQTTDLLIPSASYSYLSSDDEIYPKAGWRMDGNLAGAWEGIVSNVSFARLRLFAKGVYSFDDLTKFLARGQAGVMVTDDFDRLPLTQRFYSGGDQFVRGYRLNEISPVNSEGQRIGGRQLLVGSLEINRQIWGDWGAALFGDAGYVANDGVGPLKVGVGLGVRWRSPVGPVRLDFGVPLMKALDPIQVHLVLGPDL